MVDPRDRESVLVDRTAKQELKQGEVNGVGTRRVPMEGTSE